MATGRGGANKLARNKRTETQKRRLSEQPIRTMANKRRKLAKHVRRNPNDQQAVSGGSNEERRNVPSVRTKQGLQPISGLPYKAYQETIPNQHKPHRFKQVNEDHLGLVRISATTLLKMHQYKTYLLGISESLSEANEKFSTDPLK